MQGHFSVSPTAPTFLKFSDVDLRFDKAFDFRGIVAALITNATIVNGLFSLVPLFFFRNLT
jgi:hypothetical protein